MDGIELIIFLILGIFMFRAILGIFAALIGLIISFFWFWLICVGLGTVLILITSLFESHHDVAVNQVRGAAAANSSWPFLIIYLLAFTSAIGSIYYYSKRWIANKKAKKDAQITIPIAEYKELKKKKREDDIDLKASTSRLNALRKEPVKANPPLPKLEAPAKFIVKPIITKLTNLDEESMARFKLMHPWVLVNVPNNFCKAFLEESEWLHDKTNKYPSLEDQLSILSDVSKGFSWNGKIEKP